MFVFPKGILKCILHTNVVLLTKINHFHNGKGPTSLNKKIAKN